MSIDDTMFDVLFRLKNTALLLAAQEPKAVNRKQESYLIRRIIEMYLRCHEGNDVNKSWLLAALLYLETILARESEVLLLMDTQRDCVNELRSSLERLIQSPTEFGYPSHVLLWVLLFGGLHSSGENTIWFRSTIHTTCAKLQLSDWVDLKRVVRDLPWVLIEIERKLRALCRLC